MDNALIADIINQFGYAGIALLIALENLFPPIPSEIILTFAGFLTLNTELTILGTVIAATCGSVVGGALLYWLGHGLSVERLTRLLDSRVGHWLHLKATDVHKAQTFFQRHGGKAIFWGRFVPIVRSLISIPAGMTHYSFRRFLAYSLLGTLIWNVVLIYLGHLAGNAWPTIAGWIASYSIVAASGLAILGIVGIAWYWYGHSKKSEKF